MPITADIAGKIYEQANKVSNDDELNQYIDWSKQNTFTRTKTFYKLATGRDFYKRQIIDKIKNENKFYGEIIDKATLNNMLDEFINIIVDNDRYINVEKLIKHRQFAKVQSGNSGDNSENINTWNTKHFIISYIDINVQSQREGTMFTESKTTVGMTIKIKKCETLEQLRLVINQVNQIASHNAAQPI